MGLFPGGSQTRRTVDDVVWIRKLDCFFSEEFHCPEKALVRFLRDSVEPNPINGPGQRVFCDFFGTMWEICGKTNLGGNCDRQDRSMRLDFGFSVGFNGPNWAHSGSALRIKIFILMLKKETKYPDA